MNTMIRTLLVTLAFGFLGCASNQPYYLPDSDDVSAAPGQAFAGDGMLYRKPMPDHRDDKQYQFFYKNCWVDNENGLPFVSKRVYACNDAF